jgi:hypothetical protein
MRFQDQEESVMSQAIRRTVHTTVISMTALLLAVAVVGCGEPPAPEVEQPGSGLVAEDAQNVQLLGYHDLQGRDALVVTALSDESNGDWVYVGHLESTWDGRPILNPITGAMEWSGTSILDVADPANPTLVWHIPNDTNKNSRGVSVVYDYAFDESGRDYLIRNSESLGDGDLDLKYQIFDITSRDSDPSQMSLVSEISGTPPDSCGPGCGGDFIMRAHKGWWSPDTGYFYAASGEPGFRNVIIQIFDLRDPTDPKFVGRAWLPGLKDGEPGYEGQYSHHPLVDEENNRLYVGYRDAGGRSQSEGGQTASFDISDPTAPTLVWSYDLKPPYRGPHTVSPIVYDEVPGAGTGQRTYAFVVDEANNTGDSAPCENPVRPASYMLDITTETEPEFASVWEVPVGDFCTSGGRFGPHQSAETINGRINRFEDKIAWIAYFNAGVRVVDLSDPMNLTELGYYIPQTTPTSHPSALDQPTAIQMNDVDIDARGFAYATDRAGGGLFILEYTGGPAGEAR